MRTSCAGTSATRHCTGRTSATRRASRLPCIRSAGPGAAPSSKSLKDGGCPLPLAQALLAILDSPLNKAGRVKAIYVHTAKNVLIQVNPQVSRRRRHAGSRPGLQPRWPATPAPRFRAGTNSRTRPPRTRARTQVRLPRTFRRFCGLLLQLLQKLSIRATNGPDKLLKVIKGPVSRHLPADAHRVAFSHSAGSVVCMRAHAERVLPADKPLVFMVGAFAHGKVEETQADEFISISQFPLSAAYALGRITNALEAKWSIV